jgi:hypothetical protein
LAFHSFAAIIVKDASVPLSARELSAAVRLEQVSRILYHYRVGSVRVYVYM